MAYYNNYNPIQESKYHSSFQKIDRLANLWKLTDSLWRHGKIREMNHELENLWKEFYADAGEPERKFFRRLSGMIRKAFELSSTARTKVERLQYLNKAAKIVLTKRNFLTMVEKTQGLGKKYKDEHEDMF